MTQPCSTLSAMFLNVTAASLLFEIMTSLSSIPLLNSLVFNFIVLFLLFTNSFFFFFSLTNLTFIYLFLFYGFNTQAITEALNPDVMFLSLFWSGGANCPEDDHPAPSKQPLLLLRLISVTLLSATVSLSTPYIHCHAG